MVFGKKKKTSKEITSTVPTPENKWWENDDGLAEETITKYGNITPEEIAERRITPEQQGILAKGNAGDNIANPDALDSAEIDKLQKAEKAMAQTEDNMEPSTFTTTPEDREAAKKNAGITGSASNVPASGEGNQEAEAKKRYNKSMMSIWDAYRNGLIDKDTAGYFTIDALANAAKNMGRSIGNVGAQFTGGSIDNGHDESMWDQRKDKIFNAELQGESESIDNYENTLKKYNLTKASTVNDLLSTVKKDIDKLGDDNPLKVAYMALAAQMANGHIDGATTLASTGGKAITSLLDLLQGKDKK